jgi:hypothetical protein
MERAIDTALPHMFSIKVLDKLPGLFKPQRYLYYCARCKWSFVVNDGRRGALRPIADGIKSLTHDEAVARAATFAAGPCPAMRVVAEAHIRLNGDGSRDSAAANGEKASRQAANTSENPPTYVVKPVFTPLESKEVPVMRDNRPPAKQYWQIR